MQNPTGKIPKAKGLGCGLSDRVPAKQVQGPEFKLQYWKKEKKGRPRIVTFSNLGIRVNMDSTIKKVQKRFLRDVEFKLHKCGVQRIWWTYWWPLNSFRT
jgi:hypothetical protein